VTLTLAVLSMHTSPLAQPGTGDGGGMNVYVRELCAALARSGVRCEVFTRAESAETPAIVSVEPGFRVHHVPAGALRPVSKERLPALVPQWTESVGARFETLADSGHPVDAIHANYWLSGEAGHALKHEHDVPLLVTFHTLDRVKADASPEEIWGGGLTRRAEAEAAIVGCADAVVASCTVEVAQLVELYGADPGRIAIVAPGVDHAFFSPGARAQARRALGFDLSAPTVLFAGRIQPLKGLTVAVDALASLREGGGGRAASSSLVVLGGPSGPRGDEELREVKARIAHNGLAGAVRLLPPQRHEILSTYFRAADACVVPSHSESFGLVALEAAACGIPVVASAVGGLTTLVDDGRTGFLVEGRQPADFAAPLRQLLESPDLAGSMGRAAARRAQAYTWETAARALRACAEGLASSVLVACG
jgi:D-inositol-3-phosphate glycosyltransferase